MFASQLLLLGKAPTLTTRPSGGPNVDMESYSNLHKMSLNGGHEKTALFYVS